MDAAGNQDATPATRDFSLRSRPAGASTAGATAVGAALGAAAGGLFHHKVGGKIGEQAGETGPLGGAGLIVAYSHSEASKVEPAVTRAVKKTIGEAEGWPRLGHQRALSSHDCQLPRQTDSRARPTGFEPAGFGSVGDRGPFLCRR